jgi:adenine deaminase
MLRDRIFSATKLTKSDLVFLNIQIVDVITQDIYTSDVAVKDGYFVGIGDYKGSGKKEIDGTGKFIIPGFIDAHAHIESTLVTPIEYSNASLPHGITAVIADPHEIANVSGIEGIKFMIENARHVPMDIHFMLPSCVPATSFENAGFTLKSHDLKPLYKMEGVSGLAEVMDFPSVLNGDPDMMQKLMDADQAGATIDGHCAGFGIDQLNAYATAQIRTDHECDTQEGLIDRARRGIYTLVREGTVCKDLLKMLPVINEKNSRQLCFATDDKHLDDLVINGGININVRLAIENGLNPVTAIQMATLNAATCYKLKNKGVIAPGYIADFSIVTDLEKLNISQVYKNGVLVAKNRELVDRIEPSAHLPSKNLITSIKIPDVTVLDLDIDMLGSHKANIIEVIPGSVVSNHLIEPVKVENGKFKINVKKDLLKIAVVERHKNLGNIAVGIIKGLKLKKGAIASTVAHDSHNLIIVGTNESDMVAAIHAIQGMQGGIVIVNKGRILSSLKLEGAGLITSRPASEVMEDLKALRNTISQMAPECSFDPFLALSFMSLVVIPHLKICDQGVFNVNTFSFIDVPYVE